MKNRCKEAREQAGLSIGQAARMFNISVECLDLFEQPDVITPDHNRIAMADRYGCSEEWLRGEGPDMDYATIKAMKGSEDLSFHDRDILAKFAASLPRKK